MGSGTVLGDKQFDIVLFDGVCNLCQGSVKFIIKRDHKKRFRYASLQSEFGKKFLTEMGLKSVPFQSIILIRGERHFVRSRAVLEVARYLSGGWPLFYSFMIIPGFIRDVVYRLIASNRYRLFGRHDECMIPTPEIKSLFIS